MKKKILRILLWLAGIFLLLLLVFTVLLYLNRDKIKMSVLSEVNTLLAVPVDVEGIEVSIRKFPSASLLFTDVYCRGAHGTPGDTLLYAREIYFEFDLWNIFSENLNIDRISFNDGTVHILRPEGGKPNYEIWKEDTASSSSVFTLEKVSFTNFKMLQYEGSANLKTRAYIDELDFSGAFTPENFQISSRGNFKVHLLTFSDTVYLKNLPVTSFFELSGNGDSSTIRKGYLEIDGIPIKFSTDIISETTSISAVQTNGDLEKIQDLAIAQNWGFPKKLNISGRGDFSFQGIFTAHEPPDIKLSFNTEKTTISGFRNSQIKNFKCSGVYRLKNDRDHISLANFSGKGKTGSFSGTLDINNLSKPGIVLDLKSDLEISEWLIFIPLDTVINPQGRAIVDLHFENKFESLENIKPAELKRARASGNFKLENVSFAFKNSEKGIENLNGDLTFAGNDLKVKSFSFETGSSDIFLEGTFENVLNFIYFENEKLRIDTRVYSGNLLMGDFLLSRNSNKPGESYNIAFVKSLDLELELKVDSFRFDKFSASNIKGQLDVKNGIISGQSISLNADDGNFTGHFTIDTRPEKEYILSAGLNAQAINIHDLFVSFRNFGQQAIIAENLYGTADLAMQYSSTMSPDLQINIATIEMTSNLKITNGNLKNYDPLMALSDYADLQELKDVRFERLENNISIRNSQIIIPKMSINSNVMDMDIEGKHGFDNHINYVIRIKLSDVLFANRKKKIKTSEFDEHLIEIEKEDDPNIYIKMTGSAIDPVIELDKKSIGRSINKDLKEEGRELKDIFKKDKDKEEDKNDSGIKFDLFGEDGP